MKKADGFRIIIPCITLYRINVSIFLYFLVFWVPVNTSSSSSGGIVAVIKNNPCFSATFPFSVTSWSYYLDYRVNASIFLSVGCQLLAAAAATQWRKYGKNKKGMEKTRKADGFRIIML